MKIKPTDRLQKSKAAQLIEVIRVHAAAIIAAHNTPDQSVIFQNRLLAGLLVTCLRRAQYVQCGAHFALTLGVRRFFMVTVVPRSGVDRTVN